MDCEMVLAKKLQKKRISFAHAERIQTMKQEKLHKYRTKDPNFISSELYKQEYEKLVKKAF